MLIDRLVSRITQLHTPIVVGLDPRLDTIPPYIIEEASVNSSDKLQAAAEAIVTFNKKIIDEIYDIVPAVKPQIAMYEQFGPLGLHAYIHTVDYAKSKSLIVIGDVKRGDISSTAEAYSNMHIGRVNVSDEEIQICKTDFITVNPYMGFDSVQPYLADCKKYDKGLFVLVKTSNKGSKDIQDILVPSPQRRSFFNRDTTSIGINVPCFKCDVSIQMQPLFTHVGQLVEEWGCDLIGDCGYSNIGAVVGATHPNEAAQLRKLMPHTFFLVPGYGEQGGKGEDLKGLWVENYGAIVSSSRAITGAYLSERYRCEEKDFAKASREAVLDMKADLEAFI